MLGGRRGKRRDQGWGDAPFNGELADVGTLGSANKVLNRRFRTLGKSSWGKSVTGEEAKGGSLWQGNQYTSIMFEPASRAVFGDSMCTDVLPATQLLLFSLQIWLLQAFARQADVCARAPWGAQAWGRHLHECKGCALQISMVPC